MRTVSPSSAFARHYSRNHTCFLFLRVLRCFTSPRSLPTPMYSAAGDTTSLVPGFPIRTSSDQRSVDSSPRHIAASHVLHRLLMPRHPPCALKHLQHKKTTRTKPADKNQQILLRCSQPLSNKQTPHPTTKMKRHHHLAQRPGQHGVVSGPNSVFGASAAPSTRPRKRFVVVHQAGTHYRPPTPHGSPPHNGNVFRGAP